MACVLSLSLCVCVVSATHVTFGESEFSRSITSIVPRLLHRRRVQSGTHCSLHAQECMERGTV